MTSIAVFAIARLRLRLRDEHGWVESFLTVGLSLTSSATRTAADTYNTDMFSYLISKSQCHSVKSAGGTPGRLEVTPGHSSNGVARAAAGQAPQTIGSDLNLHIPQ